ncbi:Uncharacterised protein [Amycolatopsis camponoti]|uniref:Uncharacterized protein n=1 Tax=Amycolatopsis camponoti TaxID=2606593 RepID=A0A6I8M3K2_9PSEU|nr:Uncharacterised protein [Amycolatopsis camponoti]
MFVTSTFGTNMFVPGSSQPPGHTPSGPIRSTRHHEHSCPTNISGRQNSETKAKHGPAAKLVWTRIGRSPIWRIPLLPQGKRRGIDHSGTLPEKTG